MRGFGLNSDRLGNLTNFFVQLDKSNLLKTIYLDIHVLTANPLS
jgi:hypothetical protein